MMAFSIDTTEQDRWVYFDRMTRTYNTADGTKIAAELVHWASCLSDLLHIARIREEQRSAIKKGKE